MLACTCLGRTAGACRPAGLQRGEPGRRSPGAGSLPAGARPASQGQLSFQDPRTRAHYVGGTGIHSGASEASWRRRGSGVSGRAAALGSGEEFRGEAVTQAALGADAAARAVRGLQDPKVPEGRMAAEPLRRAQPRDATAHHQHPRPAAHGLRLAATRCHRAVRAGPRSSEVQRRLGAGLRDGGGAGAGLEVAEGRGWDSGAGP